MLRERPFTSGRSLQRHDRTRSNQMGGTLYAIPPQTPIYRTRSPGYRETLYKIVNLVRDHSFCAPSHPYESGAFNGPEAKNSRSQVRPAAFRFAVRGISPASRAFSLGHREQCKSGCVAIPCFLSVSPPLQERALDGRTAIQKRRTAVRRPYLHCIAR